MNPHTVGKILLLGGVILAYSGVCSAEPADPNFALVSTKVKAICAQPVSIPESSSPHLNKCDPVDLYYGFGQSPDFVKARQCAYATHDYSILAMIYANGKGIDRNWDLAIHFACKAGFAPDEIEGRVTHLVQLRDKHWQGDNFDICDDITSGYMMGVCASRQQKLSQIQLQRQIAALSASWDPTDKNALSQLQRAAADFFSARGANEVDLSGTARAALEIEEEQSLQDDFLSSLKSLENGHFPNYTAGQTANAERQLNKIYQQIEMNQDFSAGTVDRLGIKKTQRLWLKYRDAWVAFGKHKYPQVSADSWKTWLDEKRVSMLQDLIG